MVRRVASYRAAIEWLAVNDDNAWVNELISGDIVLSVSAGLVSDLFGRTDEEVTTDLRRALKRLDRKAYKG